MTLYLSKISDIDINGLVSPMVLQPTWPAANLHMLITYFCIYCISVV